MNNYTKFLVDLANVDEMIKDEDKVLNMLSSLSDDEYETFIITLINDKSSLSYDKVSTTLVNHELRRKDKESSSRTSARSIHCKRMEFQSEGQKRSRRIKDQA